MKRSLFLFLLLAGCAQNLAERLLSSDEGVRQSAASELDSAPASRRREVVALVAKKLESGNGNVRRRAIQALSRMGRDATDPLARALKNPNPRARAAAAEALGLLGADAKAAAGPLVEAEQDPAESVRLWAAVSLSKIKRTMTPSERKLFKLMYGDKEAAAVAAARPAAPLDGDPRGMLKGLSGANRQERERVIAALVERGSSVVPLLLEALDDPSEPVRDGAAEALRLLAEKGQVR